MPPDAREQLLRLPSTEMLAVFATAISRAPADTQTPLRTIAGVISGEPSTLLPKIRKRTHSPEEYATAWVQQYLNARTASTLTRRSTGVSTVADPIVDTLVEAVLGTEAGEGGLVRTIREGHRLSMEAENLIGNLLEEYLDSQLTSHGWVCCWGSTVQSVDFIGPHSKLLQVKNRSNSENSSSARVRHNTEISKWHRLFATNGASNWAALHAITGVRTLDERGFANFVRGRIAENPQALHVPTGLVYPPAPGGRTTSEA